MIERINLKHPGLLYQQPTKVTNFFIEIYEKHIRCLFDFEADEPVDKEDDAKGWKLCHNYYDILVSRENVVGREMGIQVSGKRWYVTIFINGVSNDISVYFKSLPEAKEFLKKIDDHLFTQIKLT